MGLVDLASAGGAGEAAATVVTTGLLAADFVVERLRSFI